MYNVTLITLSTRASNSEYEDSAGAFLLSLLNSEGYEVADYHLINDDYDKLLNLINTNTTNKVNLIITCGGTGLTKDDITIDVIEKIMDYEVRGITNAIHDFNLKISTNTIFSRALAAVKDESLIITFPGSFKAISEIGPYIIPLLKHGIDHLTNKKIH
ncbi:molybdopterin-binding protein [Mycoplasma sp. P36-A1]|uniref:molybdopterin-binding protein n=1 Tax=Mycoplasma sp. P36-A1 TaxID=3252900 RepID=UPI003C2E4109